MIVLTRMKAIEEINLRDRYAVVQPGVVNAWLNQALKGTGFHYAPDPSSQGACTIGGNVATNSGGPHTLKYGVTVNHVLGVEAVMPDGRIVQFGGPTGEGPGLDLVGVLGRQRRDARGRDQSLGAANARSAGRPDMLAVFESVDDATNTISEIIGAGIIPAALEMMDHGIIVPVEEAYHFGLPLDAQAVLIIEVDGLEAGLDAQRDRIVAICEAGGAREVRLAEDAEQRQKLWKCRKQAFGAVGRISPSYCTQDGVVPRTKLPKLFKRHHGNRRQVRCAHRQRISCRRWKHSSDFAVRRADAGTDRASSGGQRRNPGGVHRTGGQRHRRTRHRRGKNRLHVENVHAATIWK